MISVREGGKCFGNQWILRGLNFEIQAQERFFIIGKSGSGKSVLMKLLTGLLPPSEGAFIVDHQDVTAFSESDWNKIRNKFGVVFQGSALFDSLNILRNTGIRLYEEGKYKDSVIRDRVVEALAQVGLTADILKKLPSEISGGMRKRVGIARAIIHHPQYLFYDEPLAGLDPISSQMVDDLILQVAEKNPHVTTIVISHDMYSVKSIATRVLLIHDTEQRFLGNKHDFFQSHDPVIRQFLERSI